MHLMLLSSSITVVFEFSLSLSLCDESKCPLYLSAVDNEVHVVICCPAFGDL